MARVIKGPTVLTRAEVAQVLGVHPATVTRWASIGVLVCFRTPSGERRYNRRDVEKFLNDPRQAERAGPVPEATSAGPANRSGHADGRLQSGSRVPGRSRTLSRTACQSGGMEADVCTVAAAQAIPAETA